MEESFMKSLVIYYSKDGQNYVNGSIENLTKGNTEIVAEYIRDNFNADLFKVESFSDYPDDYYECTDVAKQELRDNARPDVKKTISDLSEYDVIFIGGPIWWGTYPMPMFTVLEKLDFNGKIVMPFSTHEGSGLGDVMRDMKKLCVGADVKSGLAIRGGSVKNASSQIDNWIKGEIK
ncbi:MAG: NAD(P)H-dependent oxidoreductase [Alphaproteobacteria bacterium]|nr:NAD(P)H-dependent oxidoreductase [Alphaproteobacteria bacterium]